MATDNQFAPAAWRRHILWWAAAAGAIALLVLTRARDLVGDSLLFAFAVKSGIDLFHPHHLMFAPAIKLIATGVELWCGGCDAPLVAGQIHTVGWAVTALVALFVILRATGGSTLLAAVGTALLLPLRGFWESATQITAYVPALGILAALTALLTTGIAERRPGLRTLLVAGLLAIAVLYHQANVLFVVPLAAFFAASREQHWARHMGAAAAGAALLVLSAYVAVFARTAPAPSIARFVQFSLSYTSGVCSGGHCDPSPDTWGAVSNLGWYGMMTAHASLARNIAALSDAPAAAMGIVGACLVAILIGVSTRQAMRGIHAPTRLLLVTWALSYGLFFTWWIPDYVQPFLLVLFPLFVLTCMCMTDLLRSFQRLAPPRLERYLAPVGIGLALLVGWGNYVRAIRPLQTRGDAYVEAVELDAATPGDCVFQTSTRVWNNLRYHFDRKAAWQAKYPIVYFFRGLELPDVYAIARDRCVVVSATFVRPDYTLHGYTPADVDGYTDRQQWLRYVHWLFDLEVDAAGQITSMRAFDVMRLSEGDAYLRLRSDRWPVRGLDELVMELDRRVSADGPRADVFRAWLAAG